MSRPPNSNTPAAGGNLSNPMPASHPYNRVSPSISTALGPASNLSATPSSAGSTPATNAARQGIGAGLGTALRPSYSLLEREKEQRDRADAQKSMSFSTPSSLLSRPSETPGISLTSQPQHHHHYHNALQRPTTTASLSASTDRPSLYGSSGGASAPPSAAASASVRRDAPSTLQIRNTATRPPSYTSPWSLSSFGADLRREAARPSIQDSRYSVKPPSPKKDTLKPGPQSATSLPPSPTNSRATPMSSSATPATTARPSASPHLQTNSTTSARQGLPLPSLSSTLGTRALSSPFDRDARDRSSSINERDAAAGTAHNRTLSASSNRDKPETTGGLGTYSGMAASPPKPASAVPSRNLYTGPPPLGSAPKDNREAQKSPVARTASITRPGERDPALSPTRNTTTPTTGAAPASTASSALPFHYGSRYSGASSSYTSNYPSYPGGTYSFGYSWAERERERIREREREREREAELRRQREEKNLRELEAARAKEKELREAREAKEREIREREREREREAQRERERLANLAKTETKSFQPPRSYGGASRQPARHDDPQLSAGADASALQQVAPQREPRPYIYKSDQRDYAYQPRETKRSRMDAAVEDQSHRRGSVSKKRQRKVDEEASAPVVRDFTALNAPQQRVSEVTSGPVEAWLKTVPDLSRVVSQQVYGGPEWTLAQTNVLDTDAVGGIVHVRFTGRMLGAGWTLRGEKDWDKATWHLSQKVFNEQIDAYKQAKIWGTDVYTDDSNIALMLVHAGWLRWQTKGANDDDVVDVTIRVVPKLVRYTGFERNGVKSRNWGNGHDGFSLVIEAVERVKITKVMLKGKKNRKARMAEMARERAVLFPPPPLREIVDILSIIAEQGPPVHTDVPIGYAKDGPGFTFSPAALQGWLNVYSDLPEERSLWTHDLVLSSAKDNYRVVLLSTSTLGNPRVTVRNVEQDSDIGTDLPPSEFHWLPQGLAVRVDGVKGMLCPVKTYKWVKRQGEEFSAAIFGEDGTPNDEPMGEEAKPVEVSGGLAASAPAVAVKA